MEFLEEEWAVRTVLVRENVVLAVLQLGGGGFINDHRGALVPLQDRRWAMRGERALHHGVDRASLVAAGGQQE